jgi:hypothetical protein
MAMLVRVVALGASLAAVGCGEPDGPYVPELCDDTFSLDRAGVWVLSDGTLEISQAEESEPDLCDHAIAWCDPGWILYIEPALQKPGVHTWNAHEGSWLGCWECMDGGENAGASAWIDEEDNVTVEITALDDDHIAGCIVPDPDSHCVEENIRFDVPCPVGGE